MKTSGNTIFISGGSAGIGFEVAKHFIEKGNKVIINGRNEERLDKALLELQGLVIIQGDLSLESERLRISKSLKENHPDLNIVINNAAEGYSYTLAKGQQTYSNANQEIQTNYIAIVHFSELLIPVLKEKEDAAIVNVTSIAGLVPSAPIPTYSASKAALHFYTQLLRDALADTTIKVFELMPPLVNTAFSAAIGGSNGISPEEVAYELLQAISEDRLDIPVGQTRSVYSALQEAVNKLKA